MTRGEFNLILEKADKDKAAKAVRDFARIFSMDERAAACIIGSSPIQIADGLTRQEVKAIIDKLKELSKSGLEFRITVRDPKKIPHVNWPQRPHFTAGWTGANGIAFDWQDLAFVCPSCGETFLFKRMGKIAFHTEKEEKTDALGKKPRIQAATPISKPLSEESEEIALGEAIDIGISPPVQVEEIQVVSQNPIDNRETEQDLESSSGDSKEKTEKVEVFDAVDVVEPLPLEMEDGGEPKEDVVMEEVIEEVPLEELPPLEPVGDSQAVNISSETALIEKAKAQAKKGEAGTDGGNDGLYNVFITNTRDSGRKEEVVKLVSQTRGISTDEARKLSSRMMIPAAKNLPKSKAEDVLNQFKKLKITGRITRAIPTSSADDK